ncbi:MAG: hypothetical protein COV65_00975, partial [Nitrosopumilales archaeon CG11_big_fil_rev_8_21_14_0_20_33_24]
MLSKTERDFVEDPSTFSKNAAKDLRYRIKRKLKRARPDLELLLQSIDVTGIDPLELLGLTDVQHTTQKDTTNKVLRSQ